MNSDEFMEELFNVKQLIDEPRPVGIVCSKYIEEELMKEGFDKKQSDPMSFFGGIDVFSFEDVSDNASILFWDKQKLIEYLKMRDEGKSHSESLFEVYDNIEDYDYLELPENISSALSEYNSMMKDIHEDMSRIMGLSSEFLDIDDV